MNAKEYAGFIVGAILTYAVVAASSGWLEEVMDFIVYLALGYFLMDRFILIRHGWKCPYDNCHFSAKTSSADMLKLIKHQHLTNRHH